MKQQIELKQEFYIESARYLNQLPKSHPCSQTHGHSFKVTFIYRGEINPKIGWLEDYNTLETKVKPLLKKIDHKLLNDIKGLENPTTENLCVWLFQQTKKVVPMIYQISIKETHNTECIFPVY